MNLPNKLTILRIILTFAFIIFLFINGMAAKISALVIFLVASLTDVLDGFIAKRNNQITNFGKLMDPIADKILILSAFIAFVGIGIVQAWMVIIIVLREVLITGLRVLALTNNKVIPADGAGKTKTVSQVVSIVIILILRTAGAEGAYENVIFAFMLLTVLFTLISGVSYLVKNKEVYYNAKTD